MQMFYSDQSVDKSVLSPPYKYGLTASPYGVHAAVCAASSNLGQKLPTISTILFTTGEGGVTSM